MSLVPLSGGVVKKQSHIAVPKIITKEIKIPEKILVLPEDTIDFTIANRIVKLTDKKKTCTVLSKLLKQANDSARKLGVQESRPLPLLDKHGNIIANVKIYEPTSKKGPLLGRTIIVNPGHGGYKPHNGEFDNGTTAVDLLNKRVEEWSENEEFAQKIIPELTSKGAKVIYASGAAANIMKVKNKYRKADAFISIHCNYIDNKDIRGKDVIFRYKNGEKLAKKLEKALKEPDNKIKIRSDVRNLGVLRATPKMPTVLIETGYVSNPWDLKAISSPLFKSKFAQNIAEGLVEFFGKKK